MSDAISQDLVDFNIVDGEMPDSYKLTGSIQQAIEAIELLGKAIGDIYSQQGHTTAGGSSYDLSRYSLTGPNVGRLLGSAEWLNPKMLGRLRITQSITFSGNQIWSYEGYTIRGRREFRLPFPPIQFTSTEGEYPVTTQTSMAAAAADATNFQVTADAALIVQNRKDDLADVDSTGDYHVSDDGVITTFDPLEAGETFTISYKFDTIPDTYDGASFNVIPDFNQGGTDLCTAALVSGTTYDITLPTVTHRVGDGNETTTFSPNHWMHRHWSSSVSEPMDGQQLYLPKVLTDNLAAGDTIPAGFLFLYDNSTSAIINGITFTYQANNQVRATGVPLTEGSSRYRIVTVGCESAATLYHTRRAQHIHNHSGKYLTSTVGDEPGIWTGERISHIDLLDLVDDGDDTADSGFTVSSVGPQRNPHPQYLHRDGFLGDFAADGTATTGNRMNALCGPLLITDTNRNVDSTTTDSFSLSFGDANGPEVYYHQSDDELRIANKELHVEEGIGAGADNPAGLKWTHTYNILDGSGNENISWSAPSDLGDTDEDKIMAVTGGIYDNGASLFYPFGSSPTDGVWKVEALKVSVNGGNIIVNILYGTHFQNDDFAKIIVYYL